MRNQFLLDTKGHCLICLKSDKLAKTGSPKCDRKVAGEGQDGIKPSKVFSLHRLCRHLKLNMRKIFHDVITPTTLPVLEKSELKGVLCDECGRLAETFSEVTLELEVLQMTLDLCLLRMKEKMEVIGNDKDVNGRGKVMEEFKREMLSSSQTLLHFGIVEQLRKETLKKSSLLIGKTLPRVPLRRLNVPIPKHAAPLTVDVQESPCSPEVSAPPTTTTPEFGALTTSPEQGSYNGIGVASTNGSWSPTSKLVQMSLSGNGLEEESEPEPEPLTKMIKTEPLTKMIKTEPDNSSTSVLPSHGYIDRVVTPIRLRRFPCGLCHRRFPTYSKMQDHRIRLHSNFGRSRKRIVKGTSKVPSSKSLIPNEQRHHIQFGDIERIELNDNLPEFFFKEEDDSDSRSIKQQPEPQHITEEPEGALEEPDPLQSFKCHKCLKQFQTLRNLRHHVTLVHEFNSVERKFECEVCRKRYVRASHLYTHKKSVHERQRHPCKFCFKEFTQLGSMRMHMKLYCRKGIEKRLRSK